ncbi:short-chain dehydrogenase [Actinomadura craniellae]|uniref:Short-chain dehydrogenase n=1 Tax=Actinomadura craniellae TaxID=2231787 RepID=A0A365GZY5_9ACTN|nr:SDR family oxidoreductase [Actinomadura craniellae]RAY12405.1 short-chain dehydrogenase [Actinomadura craniellae]
MAQGVFVVIGVGGMGLAIARRLGSGYDLLLADRDEAVLEAAATALSREGQQVVAQPADVSVRGSVAALAERAAALGPVLRLAHTAGLSPARAPVQDIIDVDLLGVAYVLEEFRRVIASGGAGVVITGMAGHGLEELPYEHENRLAELPSGELAGSPMLAARRFADGEHAHAFAKRAGRLRVRAASVSWGHVGARINSISPGVVSTPAGLAELESPNGPALKEMIDGSAVGRVGTPGDVAAAAEFLLGPAASFITGTDLLVDGGVTAAIRTGSLDLASPLLRGR